MNLDNLHDSTATSSDRGLRANPTSGAEGSLSTERRPVTTTEKTTEGVLSTAESLEVQIASTATTPLERITKPEAKVYCRQCKDGLGSEEELHTHWLATHPDELYQINQYLREVEARLQTWEIEVDETEGKMIERRHLAVSRQVL